MGVSTNAILFYGYCWKEEGFEQLTPDRVVGDDEEEDIRESWIDTAAKSRGWLNPWDHAPSFSYDDYPGYKERQAAVDAWCAEHKGELAIWYEAKNALQKQMGVEIGGHCSGDCPMPYLYVVESRIVASRGYPESITMPELMAADVKAWGLLLDDFVKEVGIDTSEAEGPGWFLVSMWN